MGASLDLTIPDATLAAMEPAQVVDTFVRHAADSRASDLFLLSESDGVELAIRRLGRMESVARLDEDLGRHTVTYLRTMAQMDISDSRRPGDGRWLYENGSLKLDLRINATPTLHGFDLAVRMLNRGLGLRKIDELGLEPAQFERLESMLQSPGGLILVSGPAETGKTTTLYACLRHLNTGEIKINTIEDPVEYALRGVRQSEVSEKLGLTFPVLLRNLLRQSPDVIMIGEIRDAETADTAVRAAITGHLVLATLHAPTAAGAVQAMLALDVNRRFLATCLRGVVVQRLVRVLCPSCRERHEFAEAPEAFAEVRSLLGPGDENTFFTAAGCDACYGTRYADRTGLFEVMTINGDVRECIVSGRRPAEIHEAAVKAGMLELRRAALLKVARGVTDAEEILRDVPSEHLGLDDRA